jgi:hypothetical protein
MVSETTPMVLAEGQHTMALDQSALLEVLEALKAAEVDDRIRQAAETIYQALIEAELSSVIGAVPHQRLSPTGIIAPGICRKTARWAYSADHCS